MLYPNEKFFTSAGQRLYHYAHEPYATSYQHATAPRSVACANKRHQTIKMNKRSTPARWQRQLAWAHRLGQWLGTMLYLIPNPILRVVQQNIAIAYAQWSAPQQQALVRENLKQTGQSLFESLLLWKTPQAQAIQMVQHCQHWHLVEQALAKQQGIIFVTPHLGCFEITSMFYAAQHPITVLYRTPKWAWLRRMVLRGRQQPGVSLAPANAQGVRMLLQALKRGEAIGILPDQTPNKAEGVWADFYGKPAYTMTLLSKLANKTQAQIIMAYGERLPNSAGFAIHLQALQPEQVNSAQALNIRLQAQIDINPSQYYWAYDRYKASRRARRKLSSSQ